MQPGGKGKLPHFNVNQQQKAIHEIRPLAFLIPYVRFHEFAAQPPEFLLKDW
jgi:hypothetical protein